MFIGGLTPQSFTLPTEGSSKFVMRYFSQRPNAYFVYGIGTIVKVFVGPFVSNRSGSRNFFQYIDI